MQELPLITDIARGSGVDGPGLRTVIFFKGCSMRCIWCHNPETWEREQEIFFHPDACIRCGECFKVCRNEAINLKENEIIIRTNCIRCGECTESCDSLALVNAGKKYPWEELADIILRDKTYYSVSGGGVTFSGGEPLLHMDYLEPLAGRLKKERVHIAFETAGNFLMEEFEEHLLPLTDLILFDVKISDEKRHEKNTGISNRTIRKNLEKLAGNSSVEVIPRIPLVAGFTATKENLSALGIWLTSLGFSRCDMLFYHPSIMKWQKLGKCAPHGLSESLFSLADEKKISSWFYHEFPSLKPKRALYFQKSISDCNG